MCSIVLLLLDLKEKDIKHEPQLRKPKCIDILIWIVKTVNDILISYYTHSAKNNFKWQ